MKKDWGIVKGGQGKNHQDVEDAGFWFGLCMLAFLAIVILALLHWNHVSPDSEPKMQFITPDTRM